MTSEPGVSVVICCLDGERFLREAIESVFAQSYDDWEILFVDDGSRDGSRRIAEEAAARRPGRIRILEHPGRANRGISASRNLALEHARGRLLAFLDADDVWLPGKLEAQVALLDAHPEVAMTYGTVQRWYGWTGRPIDARRDRWLATELPNGTLLRPPELVTLYLRTGGSAVPGICTLLVRRDAAKATGGFDDRFRGVFEDQVFLARIGLRHSVLVTDDATARYRQHADSCCAEAQLSGDYDPERPSPSRGRYLAWLEELVREHGCDDRELWRALRRELRPYGPAWRSWPWTTVPRLRERAKLGAKELLRRVLPAPLLSRAKAWLRSRAYVPPVGWVRFGDLRRTEPLSTQFGYERGLPVDRYYVECFLAGHAGDLRGRTLEVGDDAYTRRFGADRVARRDVLHVVAETPGATFIADLAAGEALPSDAFDCIVLTQTLQFVYDVRAAVATLYRILRPGGVLLASVPGITQIADEEWSESWHWSFTPVSARRLFAEAFPAEAVQVEGHGNVLAATAFLHGLCAGELREEELLHRDPSYPLLVTVRAVKPASPDRRTAADARPAA
jgi:glycosyltransferase involved in cell wall biosynthesis/SAM-dependent methyltransferase